MDGVTGVCRQAERLGEGPMPVIKGGTETVSEIRVTMSASSGPDAPLREALPSSS